MSGGVNSSNPRGDRFALVTGGAGGIGSAITLALAEAGFGVVIACHGRQAGAEALAADIISMGGSAFVCVADLTREDSAGILAGAVRRHFGRIDCLVNNAGHGVETRMGRLDRAGLAATIAVNLTAPLHLIDACLPLFDRGGSIINISSLNSRRPPPGFSGYAASKAALEAATRTLAMELGGSQIRVNAILPGPVERADAPRPAEMIDDLIAGTPLGRLGTPRDIAMLATFLASDAASFISGETIAVTGGWGL